MSHEKSFSSLMVHARPEAVGLPSRICQFVYPSSCSRYAAHSPVGPAPTMTIFGLSPSGGA